MSQLLTVTAQAAGTGDDGFVVTDTPATYDEGLFTCSRLQAPAALLDETQGAAFLRIRAGFAHDDAAEPFARALAFSRLRETAPRDSIDLAYIASAEQWSAEIWANGGNIAAVRSAAQTFALADELTLGIGWDDILVYLSVNGSAWVTAARSATAFSGSLDTLDLGSQGSASEIDSAILYAATFTGDPTALDPATIHAALEAGNTPTYDADAGITAAMGMADLGYDIPVVNTSAPVVA